MVDGWRSDTFYEARRDELEKRVGPRRFKHSLGVSETAEKLARVYGADETAARVAGLLHDWDKGYDDPGILARADELGMELDAELVAMPRVLHGLTAAVALGRAFPELSPEVLTAVERHTLGDAGMSDLDMIVYIADALEPGRKGKVVEKLREKIGEIELRELFLEVYAYWPSSSWSAATPSIPRPRKFGTPICPSRKSTALRPTPTPFPTEDLEPATARRGRGPGGGAQRSPRAPSRASFRGTCAKVCKQNLMFPKVRIAMTDAVEQQAAFSRECALIAAKAADEKKATDIMVQEVRDLIGVTDYFVIATAANSRQVDAIIDEIEDKLREEASIKPTHREMSADGSWSLLDYGNIVVHVFMPETREYYRLEALWNDAPVIDLAAEAGLENLQYSDRIAKLLGREAAQGDEA